MSKDFDGLGWQISKVLHSYSTGLIKITEHPKHGESAHLIGSGTFVSIDGIPGILTVYHVSRLINEPCKIGLILEEREHKYAIDRQYLEIIDIGIPREDETGPDLSFIQLPNPVVTEIRPYKSFFNLNVDLDKMLSLPPSIDAGVWFVCGIPDESTTQGPSDLGFTRAFSFYGLCGATIVDKEYHDDGWDYIEIGIEYSKSTVPPSTFGGTSGGGLWQVILQENSDGFFEPSRYLFSGVPFYQSAIQDGKRFIRCHGRQSIYSKAFAKVNKMCA